MSPRPSKPLRANARIPRPDEIALSLGELAHAFERQQPTVVPFVDDTVADGRHGDAP